MFFLLFLSIPAFSWDDVGHKLTAYVAWQTMSPATRTAVIKALREAPEDSQIGALFQTYGMEPLEIRERSFFMTVASWADIVRDREFETRYKKYHHSNWHYADTFWKQNGTAAEILTGFQDNGQALKKLYEFDKELRDTSTTAGERAIAVAWLMHLIGDLHQPLHTSGRVTDMEPKGDQGGNLFPLSPKDTPRDKQLNLHWLWDSIIVRTIVPKPDVCERDYLAKVGDSILKKFPASIAKDRLDLGNYEEMQKESFALNPTEVFTPDLMRFQEPSEQYKKRAQKIAERQIALAGYRMAALFESVLTPATAVPAKAGR